MGNMKLFTKLIRLFPFIFLAIFMISKVHGQVISTNTIAISQENKGLNIHNLNRQNLQISSLQTSVALNDGIAEGMANPQMFDLDGNGLIDPNGFGDYLFVVFEPSDFAAYGLQFPIKITGARFYNNSSQTNFSEILVANVAGTIESGTTVDLFNPLAVEQNILGPTGGFTNVNFSLAPTIFQETSIALLVQFPEGDQYTGVGENGGSGIGLDFDGADNPSYPPLGIPNRNGNSFIFNFDISEDSWQIINTTDNEPINLMMNLIVEQAPYPTIILPPLNLNAELIDDRIQLNWQAPGTTSLTELIFDDGSFESYYGFDTGTGILASGAFIPPSYPATLTHMEFLTSGTKTGTDVKINVYVDLTGFAFSPSLAFLVGSVDTQIGAGGEFQLVDLSSLAITLNSGQFFIGIESTGQGNIELGNDDDTFSDHWFDSSLEGIFYYHDAPGVYAIRSIVSLPSNSSSSDFQQITIKQKSVKPPLSLSKNKKTINDVNQAYSTNIISVPNEHEISLRKQVNELAGLMNYKIYRSSQANAKNTGIVIGQVDENTFSFDDLNPLKNNNYYVVTADYDEGESDPSNEVLVNNPQTEPVESPSGLVAWWKGENNSADSSGYNNHGTIQNGTTFNTGMVGQSFLFDGNDDYISANPDILSGASAASVEGWIKLSSYAANGQSTIIIDRTPGFDDFQFAVAPDDNNPHKLFFHFWNSAGNNYFAPSTTDIPLNTWTHVAGVYDGSEIRVYINGNQNGTPVPATGSIRSISDNLQIGDDPWNPSFNGQIDELSIYNRALTNQEIQTIYNAGSAGKKAPDLIPNITINPNHLVYGNVNVGQDKDLQLTIQNTGNTNLTVNSISSSNPQFLLISVITPFAIPAGNQQSVTVRFSPTSAVNQSGTLTINSNDPDNASVNITYSGNGISTAPPPIIAGMVGWWKGEGNASDSSGNNNHGQFNGNTTTTDGLVGHTLKFSGGTDVVIIPDSPELNPSKFLTIETWIYPTSLPNAEPIIINKEISPAQANSIQYELALNNGIAGNVQIGQLIFYVEGVSQNIPDAGNGWSDGGGIIPLNQWTHIALTVDLDSGKVRSYIDGFKTEYNVPTNLTINQTTGELRIGNRTQINMPFSGSIDELTIYNRALSSSEIQSIHSAGSAGKKKSPEKIPNIAVSPTSLDFGDVEIGQNTDLQVTIQNTGNATLTVNSISISDPQFSLVSVTTPFDISPGNQQSITVRFSPSSAGNQNNTLTINSNDQNEAEVIIQLTGSGLILNVSSPTFSQNPGVFDSPQEIILSTTTTDAKIYYTLNGNEPNEQNSLYSEPITISSTTTIKAKAFKENWMPSATMSGIFTIRSSISGKVMDYQNQDPIEGVEMNLTGIISKSTRTDEQANYQFNKILTGYSYKITPDLPGIFFQPSSIEFTNLAEPQENQNFTGSLFGDISGNDEVKAYDASILLRFVVGSMNLSNPKRDSIAADVSGDGNIKSFDASLILRQTVGAIPGFPVEGYTFSKNAVTFSHIIVHLQGDYSASEKKLMATINIENAEDVYSADLTFSINQSVLKLNSVKTGEIASDFLLAHSVHNEEIHVGMAGISPVNTNGKLLYLQFDILSSDWGKNEIPLELKGISFNENDHDIQIINRSPEIETIPNQFTLFQNHPNPFNGETIIRYKIPENNGLTNKSDSSINKNETVHVKLKIVNMLGYEVCDLVNTPQKPGDYNVVWDGKDQLGNAVSSGIYFYMIQAGDFKDKKKMLLLQ